MKDFSNASFPPDTIQVMTVAMNSALATLPHPVSSTHVQSVAETFLRTAKDGERDPKVLERMALLELQISSRLLVSCPNRVACYRWMLQVDGSGCSIH